MNLKEAFRFQNRLQSLIGQTQFALSKDANVLKIENTCLRSKVMEGAEDETIIENASSEYAGRANELMQLLMFLLKQKERLALAVHETKKQLPIDMDSETALNSQRQNIANTFRTLVDRRSSERIISGGGTGYRFNAEGNQVTYRCDVRKVTTINFDRNAARKYLAQLNRRADEISVEIDQCMVNYPVDYEAPFDVNDSFDDILDQLFS